MNDSKLSYVFFLNRRETLTLFSLALVSAVGCTFLFWHFAAYPACGMCDAVVYGVDAAHIQKHGLTSKLPSDGLRTYGYASFLSIVFAGYEWEPTWGIFSPRPAVAQSFLYICACLALFAAIFRHSRTFAWCAAIGLLCNPFVLNYVPIRLTEGFTAIIAVFLASCAVVAGRENPSRVIAALLIGSLLAGFALVVRPANLSLSLGWVAAVAIVAWRQQGLRTAILTVAAVGMIVPLLPQIAINYFLYDKVGFFPTSGLGDYQTRLGLSNLKYATLVQPDRTATPLFYRNSLFDKAEIAQHGIWLYLMFPLKGAVTAAAHVFQSVNHDYFFTYIHNRNAWVNAPVNFAGHAMLFMAGVASWNRIAWANIQRHWASPIAVLALVAVAVTVLINSVSVVEVRFGMLVYLVAGPLCALGCFRTSRSPNRRAILAGMVIYAAGALALSFRLMP